MDVRQIRDKSIESARQLGVDVLPTLPLLDADLQMRSANETVSRILAMTAVAASAYGFNREKAIAWLNQEALTEALSETERRFLVEGAGEAEQFKQQVEGMWALAWAIGLADELNFAKDCDARFVTLLPNLRQSESSAGFGKSTSPRPLQQVIASGDLAYCLHWAIRQAELGGKRPPGNLKPYVVIERRRALEWLLSREAWDTVSLDT